MIKSISCAFFFYGDPALHVFNRNKEECFITLMTPELEVVEDNSLMHIVTWVFYYCYKVLFFFIIAPMTDIFP